MSLPVLIALGLAGGVGALARFGLDIAVSTRTSRAFPLGTLAVNLSGAFLLGFLVGAALSGDGFRIVGTGFVGAYTTFSTWMFESQRLGEDGQMRLGWLNVVASLGLGLAMAWLGRKIGAAV